jgi:hypothetical protein
VAIAVASFLFAELRGQCSDIGRSLFFEILKAQDYKPEDSVSEILAKGVELIKAFPAQPQWHLSGSKGLVQATYPWLERNKQRLAESGLSDVRCQALRQNDPGKVVELIGWREGRCADLFIWDNGQAGRLLFNRNNGDLQTRQ